MSEINPHEDIEDGQFDSKFGKHKTIETIETKLAPDGVEETHITHIVKATSGKQWSGSGSKFNKINWSK